MEHLTVLNLQTVAIHYAGRSVLRLEYSERLVMMTVRVVTVGGKYSRYSRY
jgi:hypothetical protein